MNNKRSLIFFLSSALIGLIGVLIVSKLWMGFDVVGIANSSFWIGGLIMVIGGGIIWGSHYGAGAHSNPKQYDGMAGHTSYSDFKYINQAIKDGLAIGVPGLILVVVSFFAAH